MTELYPIRLAASLHETLWGGRRLEHDGWKVLPTDVAIGEAWETEISTVVQNGPFAGQTLGAVVEQLGASLLGNQSIAIFGNRFPLLAKFIDANAKLSVQVHPNDDYAAQHEHGKLGKTEFWYVLAAEPGATIVHGFKAPTTRDEVRAAIENVTLEDLLHEEVVTAGDVIFVPAGTVHAIGSGVMLYELQEYSDITYRMYDYGRLTASGTLRDLHIEQSLAVTNYTVSPHVKSLPAPLITRDGYEERCLVACPYFVTREVVLKSSDNIFRGYMKGQTRGSCIILTSLDASAQVRYGTGLEAHEQLARGQTVVLPAMLGNYCIEGTGTFLFSYVPSVDDEAWNAWKAANL